MAKVIIIGAGIGGLTAGNLLLKKGHKVTIFESHLLPGGYVAGFKKNGFYFESGTLAFESSAQIFKVMKEIGVYDKVKFVRYFMAIKTDKFYAAPQTYEEFKQAFLEGYPAYSAELKNYFRKTDFMYSTFEELMSGNKGFPQNILLIPAIFKLIYLYIKYSKMKLGEFTAQGVGYRNSLYRALRSLGYPEMPVFFLGGMLAGLFLDYWHVEDGMQSWADALADNFRKLGGELNLGKKVDKIITENRKVAGVSAGGHSIEADYVISAMDYKKTFLQLLDDKSLLRKRFVEKIQKSAVSEGFVTVYLGLSISNAELAKYMKLPHVAIMDEQEGAEKLDPSDQKYFEKAGVTLFSPSQNNSKLAPEGKSSLMIQAIAPFHWQDNWGGGNKSKYMLLKELVKIALIKKATEVIPGLDKFIEFSDMATPLTYERYTGNTDGATSAWSWNPEKKFYKSAISTNIETPIKNLFIGSCWASQIGGVPGAVMAGVKCAKKIHGIEESKLVLKRDHSK
ncbi:MAG: NAD(P)/FAD-dependent oxidoreductase [Elusimicrobia bacterium]|nr:NAD(P)/FAD-dependent oxidoreductase [Elusimicrobiota bacterium]